MSFCDSINFLGSSVLLPIAFPAGTEKVRRSSFWVDFSPAEIHRVDFFVILFSGIAKQFRIRLDITYQFGIRFCKRRMAS